MAEAEGVRRYARERIMREDAEWFEEHARALEEKAERYRRLAKSIRATLANS